MGINVSMVVSVSIAPAGYKMGANYRLLSVAMLRSMGILLTSMLDK